MRLRFFAPLIILALCSLGAFAWFNQRPEQAPFFNQVSDPDIKVTDTEGSRQQSDQSAKPGMIASPEALAFSMIEALQTQNTESLKPLVTGYSEFAQELRQISLQDKDFLNNLSLSARKKLTVLALRDRYSAQEIRSLTDWEIVQVSASPDHATLALPVNLPLNLHEVRQTDESSAILALYVGPSYRELSLFKTAEGWAWNLEPILNPRVLTKIDVDILSAVSARGGSETAWLGLYASISGGSVNQELLQLP